VPLQASGDADPKRYVSRLGAQARPTRSCTLRAWASRPSVSASRMMSSAAAASCSAVYSIRLMDLTKSLLVKALENFARLPVGSVWLGPAQ
jgi:hypothetical protein